jgi:O-antigen/teichoic acid export membrane protein
MLKNGIYITLSNVIRAAMGIITIPLLIKTLGIEEYGLWALVYSTVALVFTIEGGVSLAATFFLTRDLNQPSQLSPTFSAIAVATLLLAVFAIGITYGGAPYLVNFFSALSPVQAQQAQQAIQWGSLAVGARLLQQVPIGLLQATQQYGIFSLLNLLLAILTTLALVPIALAGGRTLSLMEFFALANVLVLVCYLVVMVRWLRVQNLRFQWQGSRFREFLQYSCFTWLSSLGSLLFQRGDRLIVGKVLDIKTLGIYAAITDITVQINNLSAFPVQPLLPAIGNLWQPPHTDRVALQQVIRQGTQTNALVAVSLGAMLFYVAPQLFSSVTTRLPTAEELLCFRIAIVGYTIYSLNAVAYFALFATGAARILSIIQLSVGSFALFCIFLGVTYSGLLGAAIGNLGYIAITLLTVVSFRQMQIPFQSWLKWLKFPSIWFSLAVALCILLEGALWWQYLLLVLQLGILVVWFAVARPLPLQKLQKFVRLR